MIQPFYKYKKIKYISPTESFSNDLTYHLQAISFIRLPVFILAEHKFYSERRFRLHQQPSSRKNNFIYQKPLDNMKSKKCVKKIKIRKWERLIINITNS